MDSIAGMKRTAGCGMLDVDDDAREVTLMGWVQRRRDHGGLIFVDLRDRSGLIQIVFNPEQAPTAFEKSEDLRNEYVIAIRGQVGLRPEGTENPELSTGKVEVYASELRILDEAETPPVYIEDETDVDERLRLRYRYLDLRRPEMQKNMILRHRVVKQVRDFFDERGFLEIETPMLTRSTPEGARDFLVPSRVNPGQFFALPQSPQLFKQLLMVGGLERYFQIVRCFRDEDLRADRQPEFTQIDVEMSFVDEEDIYNIVEEMLFRLFATVGIELDRQVERMPYREAMARFGTDKPDLRYGLELREITDIVAESEFKVFRNVAQSNGQIKGLNVPGGAEFTRREIDELTEFACEMGAKGLAWIRRDEEYTSPIAKFFSPEELQAISSRLESSPGDLMLFVADRPQTVAFVLGQLRRRLAHRLDLIPEDEYKLVWITEFPLFSYEEGQGYMPNHHPFTSPVREDLELLDQDPGQVRSRAYDIVLNGVEIGGGSIRIHNREIQEKVFTVLNLSPEEQQNKFGFLLEAFEYGTPPHGGIAFGLDRMIMLFAGRDTIRDVIAFPKTQSATCLMTGAPTEVDPGQLRELGLNPIE